MYDHLYVFEWFINTTKKIAAETNAFLDIFDRNLRFLL